MIIRSVVKKSQYFDSVTLMNIAREMRGLPGIEDAALVMGTEANKGLLKHAELYTKEIESATANDLILVLKGKEESLEQTIYNILYNNIIPTPIIIPSMKWF